MPTPRKKSTKKTLSSNKSFTIKNPDNKQLIDTLGASKILNIPVSTLQKWRSTGLVKIPYIKIGRQVKYDPQVLRQKIKELTVDG